MRLKLLSNGTWKVVAEADSHGVCELEAALVAHQQTKQYRATVVGILALWERIPLEGPRRLGTDLYHCVDADHGIYEFIKGDLRLYCFEAKGRLVVCSHVDKKSTQKTKVRDKQRAIELRKRYLKAEQDRTLEIFEE